MDNKIKTRYKIKKRVYDNLTTYEGIGIVGDIPISKPSKIERLTREDARIDAEKMASDILYENGVFNQ